MAEWVSVWFFCACFFLAFFFCLFFFEHSPRRICLYLSLCFSLSSRLDSTNSCAFLQPSPLSADPDDTRICVCGMVSATHPNTKEKEIFSPLHKMGSYKFEIVMLEEKIFVCLSIFCENLFYIPIRIAFCFHRNRRKGLERILEMFRFQIVPIVFGSTCFLRLLQLRQKWRNNHNRGRHMIICFSNANTKINHHKNWRRIIRSKRTHI